MTWTQGATEFLTALSSPAPTPGGGAAAAMAGAMGCALALMTIGTTLKRQNTPPQNRSTLLQHQPLLMDLHHQLTLCISKDAQAYAAYLAAIKLPKDSLARTQAIQDSLWLAAMVPAETATTCEKVLNELANIRPLIAPVILSDIDCARHLLKSAIACCVENIRINQTSLSNPQQQQKLEEQITHFSRVIQ